MTCGKGFLQGYILPRAYRALFLGPSSMLEDSAKKSCPSVAALHRMSKVTPRTIAYTIVLARFSMSDVKSWSLEDGSYNLRDLYDLIVRLLSDPESIFAKRTLRWWNDKVLGRKNGKSKQVAPKDVVPSTSTFNKLVAHGGGPISQGTRGGSVSRSVTPISRGGILQSHGGGVPVSRGGTKKKAV
ncbi:hypothetical protein VKT23_008161 [Stygiomarasmius scandens]|uniref:Uncharacterized protein n=1 Tax=Marasmiellus scandens TaxID=2682957 RepID=A0ABR1JIA0_9AGAR